MLALPLLLAACTDTGTEPGVIADDTLMTADPGAALDTTQTPLGVNDGEAAAVEAMAVLEPTEGNETRGQVTFTQTDEGVRVVAEISGLTGDRHGFHVHEFGDCSAPDASSAGGHFNPTGAPHGAPDASAAQRHIGDLGNIEAGADGSARYERVDEVLQLSGPNSIVGKAVIVHAGEDDLTTQPTGDAGSRLACGVIEITGG